MSTTLNISVVDPILLNVDVEPVQYIGTAQTGPQGIPGDGGFWTTDAATTIKPLDSKTVDASHLSGTLYGGLFQP